MPKIATRELIRNIIYRRDNERDNPYSVYVGATEAIATQLLNLDGSPPYVRQVDVTNKMLAYDASLKIDSELYRVTLVTDTPPDANATYWLSLDGGTTKIRVGFCYRQSRSKASFYWIFLKDE